MSRERLEEFVQELGEPKYRATQVFKAVHERRLRSFDEITDLPKKFRAKLEDAADISRLTVESKYVSVDGTRRYLMKTTEGVNPVETVFIPTSPERGFVSSTLVKEVAGFGGDVSAFVPAFVHEELQNRLA